MAALWSLSFQPRLDPSGTPYAGAKAYFYDAGTTTPQTTYTDAAQSAPNSVPVEASANGAFPSVFLAASPGSYRMRVTDSTGVVLFDVDGVDVPQASNATPPDAGDTDPTLLATTGDVKRKHGKSSEPGWVRLNGLTIGNAASGATERANADCSALFQYLWAEDITLAVSGGRGSTAAGDFAANKTIALPDYIGRTEAGLLMGGVDHGILAPSDIDNSEDNDTLGATAGTSTITLSLSQIPPHPHTGSVTISDHAHDLTLPRRGGNNSASTPAASFVADDAGTGTATGTTTAAGGATIAFTTSSAGSGAAHRNVQPTVLNTAYIKL